MEFNQAPDTSSRLGQDFAQDCLQNRRDSTPLLIHNCVESSEAG